MALRAGWNLSIPFRGSLPPAAPAGLPETPDWPLLETGDWPIGIFGLSRIGSCTLAQLKGIWNPVCALVFWHVFFAWQLQLREPVSMDQPGRKSPWSFSNCLPSGAWPNKKAFCSQPAQCLFLWGELKLLSLTCTGVTEVAGLLGPNKEALSRLTLVETGTQRTRHGDYEMGLGRKKHQQSPLAGRKNTCPHQKEKPLE